MSGIVPGPDPSMEDILASIRRILDAEPAAATPIPAAADPQDPYGADDEDELILDESMLVEDPEAAFKALLAAAAVPAPAAPLAEAEAPVPPVPEPVVTPLFNPKVPPMTASPPEPDQAEIAAPGLLGSVAADVTASSMMSLVRAVSADRSASVFRGGPTIEDLVRDEMRPLLKEWLDTHLPSLVERLVRIEIERVVNRVAP